MIYLATLGRTSVPLTGDQKLYIQQALEMVERGEWLRPYLWGQPAYYKPPFQFWMMEVGFHLLGKNLWGALVPSVFAVLMSAWLLCEVSRLLGMRQKFVMSGVWFAASVGTFTFGTVGQMEIFTVLFYLASWWAGLKYLSIAQDEPLSSRRGMGWILLAFTITGCSSWVKSPLYSILWTLSFASYLLIAGYWSIFRRKEIYISLGIGVLVASIWYVWILAVDGDAFWAQYIVRESLEKKGGNAGSVFNLTTALLVYCLPFALLLAPAARAIIRSRRSSAAITQWLIAWSWPVVLFFGLHPYKVNTYWYLLVPALAVAVDFGVYRGGRSPGFARWVSWSSGLMALICGILIALLFQTGEWTLWVFASALATFAVFAASAVLRSSGGFAWSGVLMVLLLRSISTDLGERDLAGLREFSEDNPTRVGALWDEGQNIWNESGWLSVSLGKPIRRLTNYDEMSEHLRQGGFLILKSDQEPIALSLLEKMNPGKEWNVTPWKRLQSRVKLPKDQLWNRPWSEVEPLFWREYRLIRFGD